MEITKEIKYSRNKILQSSHSSSDGKGEVLVFKDTKTGRKSSRRIPTPKGFSVLGLKNNNEKKIVTMRFKI